MDYQRLLEQHKETVYNMLLQQEPALYHPPRIEPIPSGNLPPGFNLSTDRSLYIENIHTQVTEPMIHEVFSSIGPVEACKLIRKEKSSYGFIQYHDRRSPALAIFTLNGRHLYGQPLKVNWAYTSGQREDTSEDGKEAANNDAPENSPLFATGSSEDGKEAANNDDASENKPQFTTVYVGNLAPEVTQLDLHRHFHNLCVGVIEEVQVHRNKGFGFVRYSTHGQAELAIKMANTPPFLLGKRIKCSWGNKPTPPGTRSTPLLPPAPAGLPDLSTFLAYERQLAKSKMGGVHPLHSQGQLPLPLKQASMGMGAAGANQAIYDGMESLGGHGGSSKGKRKMSSLEEFGNPYPSEWKSKR